ncbi:hypothetical protein Acr_00g0059940 [Actinidia rufa]|uniref:Putative plant transposon protein domain-containing protein n=1 Tax=Actinidia rufa TaxID=165716 RepID=A0A7J0DN85_9ERIC|nr:hypothetical protein Acr_00g0059940 [Actinidia rufa]
MVLIKHASNDPKGDDPNPSELPRVFKPRMFKSMDIQRTGLPEFKDRPITTGREFERNFPLKNYQKMLAPTHALGWTRLRPLPKDVYTNLVRFFYCNLEVGNLDNIEYTIDTRVRGKNIVLNPTILSKITGIANAEECIFISKSSKFDQYVSWKNIYIAYNIIPKAGHYNQVTIMDAFIIYKAAIDKPLNLNYIILKEMANVRNHSSRALPFGALLTKVFNHFRVKLSGQRNQYISKGFSITTIKRGISVDSNEGEDGKEEDAGTSHHAMEIEGNIEVPPQTEETYVDPGAQDLQLQLQEQETKHGKDPIHDEFPIHEESPMHGGHPSHEGTSSQGGPPAWFWFLEYFGKLNELLVRIEQRQEEIIQNQVRQEQYIDRLGDLCYEQGQQIDRLRDFYEKQGQTIDRLENLYETMHEQHTAFIQQNSNQMAEIEAQLEGL